MTEELKRHILQWYEKADHDLLAAQTIIEHRPNILDVVCFHCQQSAEKYFKAFLVFKGANFPKTHDLILLQDLCAEFDGSFTEITLKTLGEFAVRFRYPDSALSPDLTEAQEYLGITESVKQLVRSKINLD